MSVASSLVELSATKCPVLYSFLEEYLRWSFDESEVPYRRLYDYTVRIAGNLFLDTKEYCSARGLSEPMHFLVTCSNVSKTGVIDVSSVFSQSKMEDVKAINRLAVINFREIVALFTLTRAIIEHKDDKEWDSVKSTLLLMHLSRDNLSARKNYLYGSLFTLGKHFRFSDFAGKSGISAGVPKESILEEIFRSCVLFIVAHEFGHMLWRADTDRQEGFKQVIGSYLARQNEGHNLACMRVGGEYRDEAAKRLMAVRPENIDSYVRELDLEEIFCDLNAGEYICGYIARDFLFASDELREEYPDLISRLALGKVVIAYLSIILCNMPRISATTEHLVATFDLQSSGVLSVEKTELLFERLEQHEHMWATRAITRYFFSQHMYDQKALDVVDDQFPSDLKENFRQFSEAQQRAGMKYPLSYILSVCMNELLSTMLNLDGIASANALGRLVSLIEEQRAEQPESATFDIFSYLILGFVKNPAHVADTR